MKSGKLNIIRTRFANIGIACLYILVTVLFLISVPVLAPMAYGQGARPSQTCPSTAPRSTIVWKRFLKSVENQYDPDNLSQRGVSLSLGHALGRLANGVNNNPDRERAYACVSLGLEQLYASDIVFGLGSNANQYKLVLEAARGFHDDEIRTLTGVTATSVLPDVFDEIEEKADEVIIFSDSASDLGSGSLARQNSATTNNTPIPKPGATHPCGDSSAPVSATWSFCARFWGCDGSTFFEKRGFLCRSDHSYDIVEGGFTRYKCDENWHNCKQTDAPKIDFESIDMTGEQTKYVWNNGKSWGYRKAEDGYSPPTPDKKTTSPLITEDTSPSPDDSEEVKRLKAQARKIQERIDAWEGKTETGGMGEDTPNNDNISETRATCPYDAVTYRGSKKTVYCFCPATATQKGTVWGTGIYTDDSSICRAAVHAGEISEDGGYVQFTVSGGRRSYDGSTVQGIYSKSYGNWKGSFNFGNFTTTQSEYCPRDARSNRGSNRTLTCYCSPKASGQGRIWGDGIYTDDSMICSAARHDGIISASGGEVTLRMRSGLPSYTASSRNGVTSMAYGKWEGSYSFVRNN